jgi:hypothetical protein
MTKVILLMIFAVTLGARLDLRAQDNGDVPEYILTVQLLKSTLDIQELL